MVYDETSPRIRGIYFVNYLYMTQSKLTYLRFTIKYNSHCAERYFPFKLNAFKQTSIKIQKQKTDYFTTTVVVILIDKLMVDGCWLMVGD